jgi:hypothetical protein
MRNTLGHNFANYWDINDGPRTTNHAESYHGHQRHNYPQLNAPLGQFLTTFQEVSYMLDYYLNEHYRYIIWTRNEPKTCDRVENSRVPVIRDMWQTMAVFKN